jgi:flagellar biosynthesis protein FlhG
MESIRQIVPSGKHMGSISKRIWTIGSGKGGVGKSLLTASLGVVLARVGRTVIIVDANLGLPNLHTHVAASTQGLSLLDVLHNRVPLEEALSSTPHSGLSLLSCTGDAPGSADLTDADRERMMEYINNLDADHTIVDAGTGTSLAVMDFFNMSEEAIVITTPDPSSTPGTYGFLKNAIYRKLRLALSPHPAAAQALKEIHREPGMSKPRSMTQFRDLLAAEDQEAVEKLDMIVAGYHPWVLYNMGAPDSDSQGFEQMQSAARQFLGVDIRRLGSVSRDDKVCGNVKATASLDFDNSGCEAFRQIRQIVQKLDGYAPASDVTAMAPPTMGFNDTLDFLGRQLHVQTEDLGEGGRCVKTQVFCNGRVVMSMQSEYSSKPYDPDHRSRVRDLMRTQHFDVLRQIENKRAHI